MFDGIHVSRTTPMDGGKRRFFLNFSSREGTSSFLRDDLWVLFESKFLQSAYTERRGQQAAFFFRSTYFGLASKNFLEMVPVGPSPSSGFGQGDPLMGIRLPDVASELHCIELLEKRVADFRKLRCLDLILGRDVHVTPPLDVDSEKMIALQRRFRLNSSQAKVLEHVYSQSFLSPRKMPANTITLLHGPFGSGKTHSLVALILHLLDGQEPKPKILVAATTNVAVDNILRGLIAQGFERFARVGSAKRIHPSLFPYTCLGGGNLEESKQLESLIRSGDGSVEEIESYKALLRELRDGNMEKLLESAAVVGSTCASVESAALSSLKGTFDVVIIDEASQMIEPLTFVPLLFAKPDAKALLAGDPMQLPPTLTGGSDESEKYLGRTLFSRLTCSGGANLRPFFLDTQYRCHPDLSRLPNELFYQARLHNGVSAGDREPALAGLPHLVLVKTDECRERYCNGSFSNDGEAGLVQQTLDAFLQAGLSHESLGVICCYKSQVSTVRKCLQAADGHLANIQVATVDAFQGAEREIICLSTVRTNSLGGLLTSWKRVNVSLTRARRHLIVFANEHLLKRNVTWRKVVQSATNYRASDWLSNIRSLEKLATEG
mmetsp:Transcript_11360/g.34764  ORF Transcript_11360/g.34764 Transcript_11360/m.34764 type:complete len:606 (-) Transcript_11360:60-1877(-)